MISSVIISISIFLLPPLLCGYVMGRILDTDECISLRRIINVCAMLLMILMCIFFVIGYAFYIRRGGQDGFLVISFCLLSLFLLGMSPMVLNYSLMFACRKKGRKR